MKNFFIGFLLIFLNFTLGVNSCVIDVLPDFIGYWLLLKGMNELAQYSPRFTEARTVTKVMVAYTAAVWVLDAIGFSGSWGLVGSVLGILALVGQLYITYHIVLGIRDMELALSADLRGAVLLKVWKVLAALSVTATVCASLATALYADSLGALAGLLMVADVITALVFTYYIYKSGKDYEFVLAHPAVIAAEETGKAPSEENADAPAEPEE